MNIIGAGQLSEEEIALKLTEGYRLVSYEYCLSFIVVTLKRPTSIYLVTPKDSDFGNRALFSSLSFFIGWWGIPWGPIYTVSTIYRNLSGGHDHSKALIDHVLAKNPSGPPALPPVYPASAVSGKTPGVALAALILGLASLVLFGPFTAVPAIICGHIALIQIKKDPAKKGRGMAVTGLIIGYAIMLFYAAIFIYIAQRADGISD
ncbi:MAG: hypothetical protein K0R17_2912 [Rariglobus sp.]|jgi:hypothetical protein|nr:hypothetical protein [Rariglobus sp.]